MSLRYVFDYRSPFSYLASSQLATLGVSSIEYRPVDAIKLMEKVNNQPSSKCMNKLKYSLLDAARWAAHYGVTLQANRGFFASPDALGVARTLLCGALAAQAAGVFPQYNQAIFDAMWKTPQDLISPEVRSKVLEAAGLEARALWEAAADPAMNEKLDQNGEHAATAGAFGVPTFFVGSEIFFGNDRLEMVRASLAALKNADAGRAS